MKLLKSDVWKKLLPRRVPRPITFGVGAAKTGTSSLAAVLKRAGIAAAHEPACEDLIKLILARQSGSLTSEEFRTSLKAIIGAQSLEANISQINGFVIDDLFTIFPSAKYILTVRDAESWVLSFLNHATTRSLASDNVWHQFRALRFDRGLPHRADDESLRLLGLQSIDSYLTYWLENTLRILNRVPERQLLLVSTANLENELERVAEFIGFEGTLSVENAHQNVGSYSGERLVEPDFLKARCASFTDRLLDNARDHVSPQQWKTLRDIVQPTGQSYYALPQNQRIAITESLRAQRTTDIRRWRNVHVESDDRWDGRARLAASMVSDQPSVADLGCGSMLIERYLKKGVQYVPIDVVLRDTRTIVWDLNAHAGRLPPDVQTSCVVALGLLEYMHDVSAVLSNIARRFDCAVCSYLPTDVNPSIDQRRATGWVNDYSVLEMESAFAAAGFVIEKTQVYLEKTHLWRLSTLPPDTPTP